jgi:uncharacterized NAD(P)/FAD-binding protein YdhS
MKSSPSTASHGQTSGPGASTFDVAFVGTGISNTFTLIELLTLLERQRPGSARVLLIDRDADFFKGVPYGDRSGDLGLIISRLSDFLPDTHLGQFGEWLAANRDRAFERFFALGGEGVETWRGKYWHEVEAGEIADLYVPRYIFGLYFQYIAERAIERARAQGVASCDTAIGEVVDLERTDDGFTIVTRNDSGGEERFHAHRVVLGLGSAPSRRILEPQFGALPSPPGCALIEDPFEPGIADMLDRIRAAADLAEGADGRVLIIGSNAGALDVIFNLMNDRTIASSIRLIEVMSTSGKLPELFHAQPAQLRPALAHRALNQLASRETVLADDILEAVRQDIDSARRGGFTISDTFSDISAGFNSLLERLPPEERLRFACDTGPRIGALQRKVGLDYWSVVDDLFREGRLVVTQSRFPEGAGDLERGDLLAIVNCSGSERLSSPLLHSELIGNLLRRAWLRPTGSDLGICVTDDLETDTPGLYAIGPMLTGNVLQDGPAWNLEHCGRIDLFARQLAAHLVDRAFAGSRS